MFIIDSHFFDEMAAIWKIMHFDWRLGQSAQIMVFRGGQTLAAH